MGPRGRFRINNSRDRLFGFNGRLDLVYVVFLGMFFFRGSNLMLKCCKGDFEGFPENNSALVELVVHHDPCFSRKMAGARGVF